MPTLRRQIDPTLKAAILNYFAKKFHDGSGIFKEGEKELWFCSRMLFVS